MHFTKVGNLYKVVRITGPSHNFLAIELMSVHSKEDVKVESLPPSGNENAFLTKDEIKSNVLAGLSEANAKFGTDHRPVKIQFIPTDSPPPETYKFLGYSIIEWIQTQGL